MAGFNYQRPRATAQRLIERFGKPAVLRQIASGSGPGYDPDAGAVTEHPVVVVDVNSQLRPIGRRDDSAVLTTHTVIVAPELGVSPRETDRLIISGVEYGIAAVRPVEPGPVLLLWEVDLAD